MLTVFSEVIDFLGKGRLDVWIEGKSERVLMLEQKAGGQVKTIYVPQRLRNNASSLPATWS